MDFIYFSFVILHCQGPPENLNKSSMNEFHFQTQGERVSIKYDAFYLNKLGGFIRLRCAP